MGPKIEEPPPIFEENLFYLRRTSPSAPKNEEPRGCPAVWAATATACMTGQDRNNSTVIIVMIVIIVITVIIVIIVIILIIVIAVIMMMIVIVLAIQ